MLSDDVKLILMSVGATAAVISLLFAIRNRIVDNRCSLKISHTIHAVLVGFEAEFSGMVVTVYLLNTGNMPLYIHRPRIKIPFKKDGFDQYELLNLKENPSYPLKLEPGEEHKVEASINSLVKSFSFLKWYRKIRFEVKDSKGNVYKSKKIWFREIIKQAELERKLLEQSA